MVPSRKQRRRREKLKRHEYEYVVETEDGEVVPLEKPREREKAEKERGGAAPRDRRGREVPKPSLQRVLKRTAIFGPLLLVLVYITQGERLTPVQMVFNVVVLLAFFIPFSYMVDVLVYRMVMRRQRRQGERGRGGGS